PAEREVRPRPAAARRGLLLRRLLPLLAGLPPPPGQPAGAPGLAAPQPPQSTIPAGTNRERTCGDRAGPAGGVQGRSARPARRRSLRRRRVRLHLRSRPARPVVVHADPAAAAPSARAAAAGQLGGGRTGD